MQIELYKDDVLFIAEILSWASLNTIMKKLKKGITSRECDELVCCPLTKEALTELVGYLSLEANHNKSKRIAESACEIADYLEVQWRWIVTLL